MGCEAALGGGSDGHGQEDFSNACKVCTFVERRDKLLVAKINFLLKHARRQKALCDSAKLKKAEYYYLGQNQHIKNEQIYYARTGESILDKVAAGFTQEHKKNGSILYYVSSAQAWLPHM